MHASAFFETTVMFAIPVDGPLDAATTSPSDDAKFFPKYICYGMLHPGIHQRPAALALSEQDQAHLTGPPSCAGPCPSRAGRCPSRCGSDRRMALGLMTLYVFTMEAVGFYHGGIPVLPALPCSYSTPQSRPRRVSGQQGSVNALMLHGRGLRSLQRNARSGDSEWHSTL